MRFTPGIGPSQVEHESGIASHLACCSSAAIRLLKLIVAPFVSTVPQAPPVAPEDQPYNGTAFGDYDGDGDLDLYGGQGGSNKLYRNNDNGTFTDVTATAGVAGLSATTKGVAWGDYDNDGDLDLYVAQENAAKIGRASCRERV